MIKINNADKIELKKELETYSLDELYVSTNNLVLTDVVPGIKSSNGGEYGFYTIYRPTELVGVYEIETTCTCDFDSCGTGWEGYEILTKNKVAQLIKESNEIIRQGSLY